MSEFTKKGHRLVHEKGLLFACRAQSFVGGATPDDLPVKTEFVLSRMIVATPTTKAQVLITVRAWLSAYDDADLLAAADDIVDHAVASLKEFEGTPSVPPAGGHFN